MFIKWKKEAVSSISKVVCVCELTVNGPHTLHIQIYRFPFCAFEMTLSGHSEIGNGQQASVTAQISGVDVLV